MALSEVSSISVCPVAFRGGWKTPQDWVGFEHKFDLNSREIDLTRSFPGPTGVLYGFIKPNKIFEGAKRQVAIDTWWNLFRKWEMCTFENYFEGMVLLRIFWNHIKGHTIFLAESDLFSSLPKSDQKIWNSWSCFRHVFLLEEWALSKKDGIQSRPSMAHHLVKAYDLRR